MNRALRTNMQLRWTALRMDDPILSILGEAHHEDTRKYRPEYTAQNIYGPEYHIFRFHVMLAQSRRQSFTTQHKKQCSGGNESLSVTPRELSSFMRMCHTRT